MFGKQKKSPAEPVKTDNLAPPSPGEVYVMPEKYIVKGKVGSNKGLIIASIILLMVILVTASYFIYDLANRQTAKPAQVVNIQPPAQVEPPAEPIITPPEATTTPESSETATTTETVASTTVASDGMIVLKNSPDSDNDGLTDAEEPVFGTLPTNPDTDGDGYRDGVEVGNGYNPTKPGSSKLNESPFVISITTDFGLDDFQTLYPKEWQASIVKASTQILFTAPSGEIIRVSVKDNTQQMSALSWYLGDHPDVLVSQLPIAETRDGQLSGIYTPDTLTAYLTNTSKTKFFVFEYLTGRQAEIRYPAIMNLIIKNLKILPPVVGSVAVPATSIVATVGSGKILASQCVRPKKFCQLDPCGPLADGGNSCDDDSEGYCYEKSCLTDVDCGSGQACISVKCFSGDVGLDNKICN